MAGRSSAAWQNPSTTTTRSQPVKKLKCIVLGGANAGKTSILRKYFHGVFDPARRPTVGSDFYTKKMRDPTTLSQDATADEKKEANQLQIQLPNTTLSIQVWDTPGKERFAANQTKPMYTAAFSDNFFKNADAGVLVYDITSSTSFTHVLKWYEDLMTRIRRLEASGERTKPFPVLIVANKIDLARDRQKHSSRQRAVVPQRDVMGMTGKAFRGKDSRYEYTASAPAGSANSLTSARPTKRDRHELSTYMGTGDQTDYLQAVLNNDVQIGSYLESLLSTEDNSHPDKDMVLLWCMRNGLQHVEVSAMDGTGIQDFMNQLITMAAEASESTTLLSPSSSSTQNNNHHHHGNNNNQHHDALWTSSGRLRLNDELDLHQRYSPKEQSCFSLPFRFCCPR